MKETTSDIWKIRTVKNYPEAHNHIIVGKVVSKTAEYVHMHCRTFHFARLVNSIRDVDAGIEMERVIPWSRIEIVNVLPYNFDYINAKLTTEKDSTVLLKDQKFMCPLSSYSERRY